MTHCRTTKLASLFAFSRPDWLKFSPKTVMGNFYVNYTLRGPDQSAVASVLAGRSAIVTPALDDCVVVFDEESDEQNQEIITELASHLSGKLRCPLLAVLNHDDGILWYQLYLNGELVDGYDSAPGYFDTEDEEAALRGSEGGDAKKLCAAFETDAVAEVERILRKPSAEDGGYVFAVERHDDLVGALGIPSYGNGFSFRSFSDDDLPEDLEERDLVRTKDLPAGPPVEDIWRRPVPGYYKVSFRAHPKLTKSIPTGWMPSTWTELESRESELSEHFHKAAAAHREQFKQLGFAEQGFKKLKRVLNPGHRENCGINYMDRSRCVFGQLIYHRFYMPALEREKEGIVIAFTAVFDREILSCTNNMSQAVETLPNHKVFRIESQDVGFLHQKFVEQIKQRMEQPHYFTDLQALKTWFDANALEIFEDKVQRGLWVRMSDYEVAVARRKLPPPLSQ